MEFSVTSVFRTLLTAMAAGADLYLLLAVARVAAFRFRRPPPAGIADQPPVTILKPVCGLDHGLYDNLSSFCRQDYPAFQVVFGSRDPGDPAVAVVRRVIRDFPGCDAALVIDGRIGGRNLKVANLANMLPAAKYDLLVIADSDMRVAQSYLTTLAASFADPRVGAVTCLYRGTPAGGLASRLGALFINDWFLPSVLAALALQKLRFCFGATMAVRREALAAIGGFAALADYLADDYELGNQVSRQGHRVALSPYVVEDIVSERGFRALLAHEVRWARTIRTCRPAGYAFSPLANNALSLAALNLLLSPSGLLGPVLAILAAALRLALHFTVRAAIRPAGPARPWLLPLRDLLCLAVWAGSFLGRGVTWRENRFAVAADGRLQLKRESDR
ncbi:MAG: bacteriohopanetetrol glucosamine biosynthesis glycosyltransferase HpnI [Desulfobacteraceae bacterium]|nr:bacteriohopanetetrol glucosamine biosynthesis glycosyltransferase HpnI [Desulfobacteraceae bacterium]